MIDNKYRRLINLILFFIINLMQAVSTLLFVPNKTPTDLRPNRLVALTTFGVSARKSLALSSAL